MERVVTMQGQQPAIQVVLADGQRWSREYLASLCAHAPDLELVAVLATGQEVVERIATLQPAVAVLDTCLDQLDTAAAISQLAACAPSTQIVILLPDASGSLPRQIYTAGVTSIVLRSTSPETLLQVIRAAARGDGLFQREVVPHAVSFPQEQSPIHRPVEVLDGLSPRESQVLCLVAEQRSNRAIADELRITEDTVKKHVRSIFAKLRVANRREAALHVETLRQRRHLV